MTREIALHCMKSASELERELCEECPIYGQTGCDHCYEDALQYVIGMLEQEPCENAISRADALKLVRDCGRCDDKSAYGTIYHGIEHLPSVQLKPKTGHWILQPSNKEQGERDFIWWKCSECGQVIFSETEKDRREYHAFCGRCGARMIEPQESEEDKE